MSAAAYEQAKTETMDDLGRQGVPEPEPPRPLVRELPPALPYPIDALGKLAAPVEAIRDKIQAPAAVCGHSVLGAVSLAAQARADVELPIGQARPLSLSLVTIAASGERKSAADHEALWPVRTYEKELHEAWREELTHYEHELAAWKAQQRDVLADKKKHATKEAKEQALQALGAPPHAPLEPMLIAPEPTYEGLVKHFERGRPALGLFSAEGGQFLGGYAMSADNRLKTSAALSELWDGAPVRRVRSLDGSRLLYGRRLALHLMVQPGVSAHLLADPALKDQGLLSRLLVTAPDTTAGTRFWKEPAAESAFALKRYGGRLLALLRAPLPLAVDQNGERQPNELALPALVMAAPARAAWIAFADHVEAQLSPGGALAPVRGFANKAPEHAARLGGVLAIFDDHERTDLPVEFVEAGIVLVEFYLAEALRLHEAAAVAPDLALAERSLSWLQTDWPETERERARKAGRAPACVVDRIVFSLADLYQFGPAPIREAATAKRIVGILEEHGWLEGLAGAAEVAGIIRREAWRVRQT